jgi:hypothetical protein
MELYVESPYNYASRQTISIQNLPIQTEDIKRLLIKQLKTNFPNWQRLTKREKKFLINQTGSKVMADYKEERWKNVSLHKLTNISEVSPGIIQLHEMANYIGLLNQLIIIMYPFSGYMNG